MTQRKTKPKKAFDENGHELITISEPTGIVDLYEKLDLKITLRAFLNLNPGVIIAKKGDKIRIS